MAANAPPPFVGKVDNTLAHIGANAHVVILASFSITLLMMPIAFNPCHVTRPMLVAGLACSRITRPAAPYANVKLMLCAPWLYIDCFTTTLDMCFRSSSYFKDQYNANGALAPGKQTCLASHCYSLLAEAWGERHCDEVSVCANVSPDTTR